jgi:PAS domain S-box-containing protein
VAARGQARKSSVVEAIGAALTGLVRGRKTEVAAAVQPDFSAQISEFSRQSQAGMVVADVNGVVLWANDALYAITGQGAAHVIGRKFSSVLLGSNANDAATPMHELFSTGKPFRAELLNQKDNQGVWSEVEARAIRGEDGAVTHFVAQLTDITQHKQAEQTLKHESDVAGATAQEKSDLLASMSHEIRTPLMTILGYAEVMLDPTQTNDGQRESVNAIARSSEHLLSIINNILDMSKIEAGRMQIERIACSPSRIATDVSVFLGQAAQQKHLELSVICAGAIPKKIHSDPTLIRQILINLVGNAIKFTASGKVTVEIALDKSGEKPMLRCIVSDTGAGMDAERMRKLFEPFSQGGVATTRNYGGTGLGLHISRRLAHLLGGDITVTSHVGVGSTFAVTIDPGPLGGTEMIERPEATAHDCESGLRLAASPGHLPGRILVVEDSEDNQRLLAFIMRRAGATVDIAETGEAACELAMVACKNATPYDIILMDMQLRGISGFEATARLRKQGYPGTIVAFTANTLQGDRERCLRAGCNGYLPKPIDCRRLLSALEPYVMLARKVDSTEAVKLESDLAKDPGFAALIEVFVSRMPIHIEALDKAFAARDLAQLAHIAHQLKGVATSYGYPSISAAAAKLEVCLKDSPGQEGLGVLVHDLMALCQRAL